MLELGCTLSNLANNWQHKSFSAKFFRREQGRCVAENLKHNVGAFFNVFIHNVVPYKTLILLFANFQTIANQLCLVTLASFIRIQGVRPCP